MKKSLLLTLVSLLVFNAVAWGEDCIPLNDTNSWTFKKNTSKTYNLSYAVSSGTLTFDIELPGSCTGTLTITDNNDKSIYSQNLYNLAEKFSKKTVSQSVTINNVTSSLKFSIGSGTLDKKLKNVKVVQSKYLRIDKTSIDFGNVLFSQQSEQTVKVSYSATSGTVTSNNSAFIVSSGTAGNADCGKFGDQNITVTFKPTTIGDFSGTVNIGGNNITVQGKCVLPAPTLSNTAKSYTTARLSWNSVGGATGYRLYNNGSKFGEDIPSTQTSIDLTGLAMHTAYKFTITALSGSVESNPSNEVAFSTNDLAASAYINVSNASYSSVDAQWAAIPDATGYKIVSNNGVVNIFEGHDVTSGTLVGLTPNTTYTFTIYGMYGNEVSKNSKTSNSIGTLETKCLAQSFSNKTVGDATWGGFNYDSKPYEITTEKNNPIVSFSYATSSNAATALGDDKKMFRVKEYVNGQWQNSSWSTDSRSGSVSVTLSRETRRIQLVFNGNFAATFSNVSVMQGSYLEVPETEIDFGNVAIGEKPSKDIVVNYSTMVGNVSKKGSDKFSTDKNQVGKDDCGYGSENIEVTFDASAVGQFTATVMVGSTEVTVKANVTLQVPTLSASEITYNSAKLSWNAVDGAEKYKLNFIGGNSIETTDIYSVCDTLKLHSSNQFTVQAYGGGQYTDPSNVVTVDTPDLAASASFSVSNPSYSSADAQWAAVPDATGYRIVSNDGVVNVFDGGATTSGILVGLQPNKTYTFTVYGMYGNDVSNNGKASNEISTKETKCESQSVSNFTLKDCTGGGFDYSEAEQLITTDKNEPKISFSFEAKNLSIFPATGYKFTIKESSDNSNWSTAWTTEEGKVKSGTANVQLKRETRYIKVAYKGNFCGQFSNINIYQGSYLEASPETVDFGTAKVGQNVDAKTISVNYSTMEGDVISGNVERFQTSKSIVGADDCRYGIETFDVTANTEVEPGTYQADITVGTQKVPAKITIEALPAANITAAATGKSAISVQWDKVSGATGYKLTCDDAGIDVTLPDTGSEHYSYNATGLNECTQYTFTITTMYNAIENESASASATTYSTVKVEKAGAFAETTTFTLSGVEGQWNKDENSFASGSTATINASNSNVCAKFDKLTIGETEYTTLPQAFTVNAPVTATIYYTGKELDAPVLTVNCGSKNSAELSWSAVECADSYTVYVNGIETETGITATSYTANGLTPATDYTFVVKAVSGSLETASESATATTYGVIKVQVGGDATSTTDWTLTGEAGKWNKTEESFEVGSQVSILASNSDAGVIFDKIQYYGGESTINPTSITVLNASVAETWAGIYYKYNGVAKTDDGEVFQTLNDAVEYSKTHAVSEITLLADRTSENLDVTSGSNITINGQGFKIGNVIVESDAKLTTSGTLIVGDLNIKTEYRNSGEVDPKDDNLQVTGKASFDKILDPSGKVNSSMWYAVCVPFEVKVSDIRGLDEEGNEHSMVWDKDYIVDEYDGTKRAATGKGWFDLSANSILTPGKMYIVAAIKYNTWRFYKTIGSPIVSDLTSIPLSEFESSNIKNQGWNAIGNSQIFHVDLNTETEFGQVLVNGKKTYDIVKLSEESFAVAAPLFIQYASGSKDVNLTMKSHSSLRSVSVENKTFNLRITGFNSTEYADQLFLTASEYASADYVIGKDLVKMGDLTGVSDARIWMKAKSANLCVMDAKLIDGVTVIPLGIYVPKSGNYEFYLNSFADGVKLELLYNGEIIHNFADGSFSTALAKGSSDSYSLKVSVDADAPIVTDADEVDGVETYITENILHIKGLNNGAEYAVHSLQNKIASGVADGGIEKVVLPAQGVYIIVSGETTIKLLNK